jgi:Ni/Fe-hydrogenase subunit HybB-like protein
MISHRAFHHQVETTSDQFENLNLGLAKGAAVTLAVYFGIKTVALALENEWHLLGTGWGLWFLLELGGFVLLPCVLFAVAYRERRMALLRVAAVMTVVGILLNRFNVTFIAFNWEIPRELRYVPTWMEVWVTVAFITFAVVAFRWIATRMPVMYEHPDWKDAH